MVDSFRFLHTAHNHVRALLGIPPFSLEVFEGYFGQPREKLYTQLYGEHREIAKTHFETFVLANHLAALKPMEGAEYLLQVLERLDVPCGVVTNKKASLVSAEIRNFGWEKHFKSVVGAGEAQADKPSAAPLLLALERAGLAVPLETVWFVGDTDNDMLCAHSAGCQSVLIEKESVYSSLKQVHPIALYKKNCRGLAEFLLQYA